MKHTISYFNNGQKHVEEYVNDYNNHILYHRLDGPAYATWYMDGKKQNEEYYVDGKCHRLDGPAYSYWDSDGSLQNIEYWVNDRQYTKEKWLIKIRKSKLKKLSELVQ